MRRVNDQICIIENGLEELNAVSRQTDDYSRTNVPDLVRTMRMHACRAMILDWSRGFTVLEKHKTTFTGTQKLDQVYGKLRKIVNNLRSNRELPEEKIPLIVFCGWKPLKSKEHMFTDWGEALFMARRIVNERETNEREIVYLCKNSISRQKLEENWQSWYDEIDSARSVSVRCETDLRDIIGPIEGGEFPEFIRLPADVQKRMYIGEREMELGEDEYLNGGRKPRRKTGKKSRIIPLLNREDENIPSLLQRITGGKTQVNLYGKRYALGIDLCYLGLDIPETIRRLIKI